MQSIARTGPRQEKSVHPPVDDRGGEGPGIFEVGFGDFTLGNPQPISFFNEHQERNQREGIEAAGDQISVGGNGDFGTEHPAARSPHFRRRQAEARPCDTLCRMAVPWPLKGCAIPTPAYYRFQSPEIRAAVRDRHVAGSY